MAIYWSNSNLQNKIENSKSVFEFSVPAGIRAITNVAGRGAGAVTTADVEYVFNTNKINRNSASYSTTTGRFTATRSGVYIVYVWLMINNAAIYNNVNWRIRINNSSDARQVYAYSSNVAANYAGTEACIVVNLAANDFVSVYTNTAPLYGNDERYTRFCVQYLG